MNGIRQMKASETSSSDARPVAVSIAGVSRSFGAVKALRQANLVVGAGEKLGLIGHNGAGKSTLMNILSGVLTPDEGTIKIADITARQMTPQLVYELGIRCIFQELSLCPNLTAIENTLMRHPGLSGWGWRSRASRLIQETLDLIFPDHGIDIDRPLESLSIAQRQVIEIAQAFAAPQSSPRLVILDEPTSSLDAKAADQLMTFLDVASERGIATILISHRLQEILAHTQRVVVMVDGAIVGDVPADTLTRQALVGMMGHLESERRKQDASTRKGVGKAVVGREQSADPLRFLARQGEIIGLAGLDGHGQRRTLLEIFSRAMKGRSDLAARDVAYVPGDRQTEGVFSIWSVAQNMTIRALRDLAKGGFINLTSERALTADWLKRVGVRTAGVDVAIGTLSGGNQQKVLFARALSSKASVVLLDDPMRGVDVGTKSEVYELIRAEAQTGRSFIWYSTETEELRNCDRVYVFRSGEIVAMLEAESITEENILRASFSDSGEGRRP